MTEQTVTLVFSSEKKHSIRYDNPSNTKPVVVTSLYVMKDAFEGRTYPDTITLTIS